MRSPPAGFLGSSLSARQHLRSVCQKKGPKGVDAFNGCCRFHRPRESSWVEGFGSETVAAARSSVR